MAEEKSFRALVPKGRARTCCSPRDVEIAAFTLGNLVQCTHCDTIWVGKTDYRGERYWESMTPEKAKEGGWVE